MTCDVTREFDCPGVTHRCFSTATHYTFTGPAGNWRFNLCQDHAMIYAEAGGQVYPLTPAEQNRSGSRG